MLSDADLVAPLHLDALGYPGGQRERPADQRVSAHEAVLHVEDMHGSAPALADTGFPGEQFRHDFLRIGAGLDGVHMIAVTGDHVVVPNPRGLQHTKGAGLLTRIEVQEATNIALHVCLVAALFKAAREQHFAQQAFLIGVFHKVPGRWLCRA
jgi:hypothetical protein